jgi:hypothetical protein
VTLPTTNATAPTEPPSFSATPQINGTILFAWTRPIVRPQGTEFQLIRSTNSANAAVGTIVWQGNALQMPLVMPTSRHWYWVRAVANSQISPFQPNTFGVEARANPEANYYDGGEPTSDPNFEHSDQRYDYWAWDTSLVNASLSVTSGVSGGYLRFNVSSDILGTVIAVIRQPYSRLVGAGVRGHMRVRVTSRTTAAASGGFSFLSLRAVGWNGQVNSAAAYLYSGRTLDAGQVVVTPVTSFQASSRWFDFTGTSSIETLFTSGSGFIDPTSYPYVVGGILFQPSSFRGVVDVDVARLFYL